MTAQPELRMHI